MTCRALPRKVADMGRAEAKRILDDLQSSPSLKRTAWRALKSLREQEQEQAVNQSDKGDYP